MNLCSIASGSSGNCIYVGSDKTSILVDAGISGKRIEQGLNSIERTTKDMNILTMSKDLECLQENTTFQFIAPKVQWKN